MFKKENNLYGIDHDENVSLIAVFLGEICTDKTGLISFLFKNEFYNILEAVFTAKIFYYEDFGESIIFEIRDTAEKEAYRSINPMFYKEAKVIVLVYDNTNKNSFNAMISYWYNVVI